MSQNIILKRSSLPGKVPDTGSLNLGELAINTYDGKVFLRRSGSIESIQEIITTNVTNTGSITLTQTGSFGELVTITDANIGNDLYVTNDIITNGSIDALGAITASVISASLFIGDGSELTGVTASMRPDDFDFNSEPFAGTIGFIQGSGSLYKVATTQQAVEFRFNDSSFATFQTDSTILYGLGNVEAFSSSVAAQFTIIDAGVF
jgi:hypothetical protein